MHLLLPILNAIFLVLYATNIETSPPKMIVFKGFVIQGIIPQEFLVSNFTECLVQCGKMEECQFVYGDGKCVLCYGGTVIVNPDGEWIGIKNVNKTAGFCPAGSINMFYEIETEDVTTENPLVTVEIPLDDVEEATEESTSEEPTTTTPKPSCPPIGWLLVGNGWCITVTSLEKSMTKLEARRACENLNTTVKSMISGLETGHELRYLKREVLKLNGKPQRSNIGVWVDGHRSSPCNTPNSICFPETFGFNDRRLRTYGGYDWYNLATASKSATCIQVMFPAIEADPRTRKTALANCNNDEDDGFVRRAVLCGTPAL
ncbi:unnamed protein product [Caenorhabditis brenneri]